MTTLFDDPGMTHHHDQNARRAVRRLALGGALQLIRTRNGWSVNDAADAAKIAPMTWRRMEDGLDVRERSHAALDLVLDLPFGSVKRALADDLLMVEFVKMAGVDVRHVALDNAAEFLALFAEQTRTGSPRQERSVDPVAQVWAQRARPASEIRDEQLLAALDQFAQHVPRVQPTPMQLATNLVETLSALNLTPAIDDAVQAVLRAMPDLIGTALRTAARDIAHDAAMAAAPEQRRPRIDQDPLVEDRAST
ncbi:MAG: hypothetical protein L0I24_00310 [Pseudonocardia sp.]|nr:hypothetical protein [Pseudonocardia sp.]